MLLREHLVHQQAQAPPIDALVVTLAQDHLGRHVLQRPTEGSCLHASTGMRLDRVSVPWPHAEVPAQPEICNHQVAIRGDEDVLGFQITIDHICVVQSLKRQGDFRRVHLDPLLRQRRFLMDKAVQVPALAKVQAQIQELRRLKREVKLNDEGMVELRKNCALGSCSLQLPVLPQLTLPQDLHRIQTT
eukprot:scaffold2022_cov261-Pinguiococcus_pyrenoidosus.AAC.20